MFLPFSKENTLRKDEIKLSFADQDETEKKTETSSDEDNEDVDAVEENGDEKDEDAEIGIKVKNQRSYLTLSKDVSRCEHTDLANF